MTVAPLSSHVLKRKHPTLLTANVLLVLGIALLMLTSLGDLPALGRYAVGAAFEIALAVLALLAMRLEDLDIRATARLQPPPHGTLALALASVPGLWVAGVVLNLVTSQILGYVTPMVPDQYPRTTAGALAVALTTVVVAPLCEELVFRGYVQRAFERWHPAAAVVVGATVFTLYHLRFQGAPALVPVAIALSAVAWRTASLWPSVLMHAAYNLIATVLVVTTSFWSSRFTEVLTAAGACLALAITPVSLGAMVLLWRRTGAPERAAAPPERRWRRRAAALPAAALCLIYTYAALSELLVGAFPQLLPRNDLVLQPPENTWREATEWRYEIQNLWGEELGDAKCTRTAASEGYKFACAANHSGWSLVDSLPSIAPSEKALDYANADSSWLSGGPGAWSLEADWDAAISVVTLTAELGGPGADRSLVYSADSGEVWEPVKGGEAVAVPVGAMFPFEWAWRLGQLPLELAYAADGLLIVCDADRCPRLRPVLVNVTGAEPVPTSAGSVVAWRVEVLVSGSGAPAHVWTAWYDSEAPHTLVRLDDGALRYVLAATTGRLSGRRGR